MTVTHTVRRTLCSQMPKAPESHGRNNHTRSGTSDAVAGVVRLQGRWWLALTYLAAAVLLPSSDAHGQDQLAGTELLEVQGDLAHQMVEGMHHWLDQQTLEIAGRRHQRWLAALKGQPEAVRQYLAARRHRLAHILGVRDPRPAAPEVIVVAEPGAPTILAMEGEIRAYWVRWRAFGNVFGEGLLLEPKGEAIAQVIAVPDADWSPFQLVGLEPGATAFAHWMAHQGCRVLVPVLINRRDQFSGHPAIRYTNQPHREFVYRGAYELGRHVIGYEIQKILAAIDSLEQRSKGKLPLGVAGYGEGGLLALYTAALEERIDSIWVSGYVGPRETLWEQPIYRNVWTLVRDFGDAEVLSLIAPRPVVIEAAKHPEVPGPPAPREGRSGAAPGAIQTPPWEAVQQEVERARQLISARGAPRESLVLYRPDRDEPGDVHSLAHFFRALTSREPHRLALNPAWKTLRPLPDPQQLQQRQIQELIEHNHWVWWTSQKERERFWAQADRSSLDAWQKTTEGYRTYFWEEVIGKLPEPCEQFRVRTRRWADESRWIGYQVVLNVYPPDVFATGILLVPKDLQPRERRPVVVCQHGLEGRAEHTIQRSGPGFGPYQAFAARLADRGYVVYTPQNPYIGGDHFRLLQRKANPLGWSLFSFIVRQHEQTLKWLAQLPFVDPTRIGFYGLSYGGKTALRVPAILRDRYALSICSADFNEWIWKNTSYTDPYSYVFTIEYEMFEFDLGSTFNYAEMAALIAPRPFMVERGHRDGVAPDEWVAYEYARVRRLYADLKIPERTEIEFFDGPHQIHGVGTFRFLDRHLNWTPRP
jgi:dienelactone hydrolase